MTALLLNKFQTLGPTAVRFLTVGVTGILVNSAVLWLAHLHVPVVVASALATEAAIIYCYFGHDLWTFRDRNHGLSWKRFRNYNGVSLVGLVITVGVLWALTETTTLPLLLANLVAIASATLWNFTMSLTWTFRRAS